MSEDINKNNLKETDVMHISYLGELLVKSIRDFQEDIYSNLEWAKILMVLPTYIRMIELRDKFHQALNIKNPDFFG